LCVSGEKFLSFEHQSLNNVSERFSDESKFILILRDPYNNFASLLCWKDTEDIDESLIATWISYAKEFLGETNFLNSSIKIIYNQWFVDVDYRKQISANFGAFTDSGLQEVPRFADGSSFDKTRYNNIAQKMKVLTRWKNCINNEKYIKAILSNEELRHYSQKIFGFHIKNNKLFL